MISTSEARLIYAALVKGSKIYGHGTDVAAFLADGEQLDPEAIRQIVGLAHRLEEPKGHRARVYQVGDNKDMLLLLVGGRVVNGNHEVDVASDWSTISLRNSGKASTEKTARFVGYTRYTGDYNASLNRFRKMTAAERMNAWSGLCPADRHGLDYEGQVCDLCVALAQEIAF